MDESLSDPDHQFYGFYILLWRVIATLIRLIKFCEKQQKESCPIIAIAQQWKQSLRVIANIQTTPLFVV